MEFVELLANVSPEGFTTIKTLNEGGKVSWSNKFMDNSTLRHQYFPLPCVFFIKVSYNGNFRIG